MAQSKNCQHYYDASNQNHSQNHSLEYKCNMFVPRHQFHTQEGEHQDTRWSSCHSCCCHCYCKDCPTGDKQSVETSVVMRGMQVQLIGNENMTIEQNHPIVFDTVLNNTTLDITYHPETGEFVITNTGDYYIFWWMTIDDPRENKTIDFSVAVDGVPYATASTPIVTGQLSGIAYLTISELPAVVTLLNISGGSVILADTSVKSSMVITKVSE